MREVTYTLQGDPVALARARMTGRRIWDAQKQLKLVHGLQLASQHANQPLFQAPIEMHLTFMMRMPQNQSKRQRDKLCHSPHVFKPDLDNLIKFIADIGTGILYTDDCIIASIYATKKYDENPRTIIIVKELAPPGV